MRKIRIMEHISLDGVIQQSADENDFPYGAWTAPYRTPAGRDAILAAYGESYDLLLGRRTYDMWSGFWPKAPSSPMADRLNAATKYVVTHRPESLAWVRSRARSRSGSIGVEKSLELYKRTQS
jgi:dihydrofolate reductase